jgi:hypothetical protein
MRVSIFVLTNTLLSSYLLSNEPAYSTQGSIPKIDALQLAKNSVASLQVDARTKQILLQKMEANGRQFFSTAIVDNKLYSIASICLAPVVSPSIRDQTVRQMAVTRLLKTAIYSSDQFNKKISPFSFHEIFREHAKSRMKLDISYKFKTDNLINLITQSGNCSACISIMPVNELKDFVDTTISKIDFNSAYHEFILENAHKYYGNKDFNSCSEYLNEALKYKGNDFQAILLRYKYFVQVGRHADASSERRNLIENFGRLFDAEQLDELLLITTEKGGADEANAWNEFIYSRVKKTLSLDDFALPHQ